MDIDLQALLKIGEKVDIEVSGKSFRSVVQEIPADDVVELAHPLHKGSFLPLKPGQKVKLDFYRPDGLYSFDGQIKDLYKRDNLDMVSLLALDEPHKHQRRLWYRLAISLPVKVRVQSRPLFGDSRLATRRIEDEFDTECLDISAGGMLFLLNQSLPVGSRVQCSFLLLDDDEEMVLNAMVVRCIWPQEKGYPYRVCIAFLDVSNRIQKKLAKFVLEQQKKLRSRGPGKKKL